MDKSVEEAMKLTDRKHYCPQEAYEDHPVPIGHAATISAPHMHVHALNLLKDYLRPGMKVLDVGVGSGYLASAMGRMVGPKGKVIGIDYIPELVKLAKTNISKADKDIMDSGVVTVIQADGWKGYESEAPFNAIHVGAAAETMPEALVEQLASPGRMIIPVGK